MRAFSPAQPPFHRPSAATAPAIPFVITPSTETPVAGVDTTWSTNAGDIGTPVSYSWDFGDGTIPVTGATPSHYFVGLGPYTVTCVVTYDDASTDTDTQVISPTAPSAVSGQTELGYETFASTSAASPGDFDYFNTVSSIFNPGISSGGKKAAASGIGWSGRIVSSKAYGRWTTGSFYDQSPYGGAPYPVYYQVGCWFKFPSLPTAPILLAGWTHRESVSTGSLADGIQLDTDGTLFTTVGGSLGKTIPLNQWFWVGVNAGSYQAGNGGNVHGKFMYKEIGSAIEVLETDILFGGGIMYYATLDATVGAFSIDNLSNTCKMTGATLHTMLNLTDGAYPEEIIPPQEVNYIYQIDPASGNDTNDGVTAPWQTVTQANSQMASGRGLESVYDVLVAGSGPWLVIDTTVEYLDVGVTGLLVRTPGMWVKPVDGQTYVSYKPYVTIDAGDWTVTGGYTGIYQIACDQPHARLWSNDVYHAKVASLVLLDAEVNGAIAIVGGVLYCKPFGGTDPRSDGKNYVYSRLRPITGGDTVGNPVVAMAHANQRVSGVHCRYTAVNENGSYVVGDIENASGILIVEDVDCAFFDKHAICWTANMTNSVITTRRFNCEQGLSQALTDYMATGSGNVHYWSDGLIAKQSLAERSSAGAYGAFYYSHGGGAARFDQITHTDCDYSRNSVASEGVATTIDWLRCTLGEVVPLAGKMTFSDCDLLHIPQLYGGSTIASSRITPYAGTQLVQAKYIGGSVSITNSNFDLTLFEGGPSVGLWQPDTSCEITFTGNTVRFGNTYPTESCPIFLNMATANIASCNNNTYYIGAAAIFAKNFNAGGGAADYTFAQWQALGYDAASTRINP